MCAGPESTIGRAEATLGTSNKARTRSPRDNQLLDHPRGRLCRFTPQRNHAKPASASPEQAVPPAPVARRQPPGATRVDRLEICLEADRPVGSSLQDFRALSLRIRSGFPFLRNPLGDQEALVQATACACWASRANRSQDHWSAVSRASSRSGADGRCFGGLTSADRSSTT